VEDEEDPEVRAERERRQRERGKKRYEEDYSFINEEFFNSWKSRTKQTQQPDSSIKIVDLAMTFKESLQAQKKRVKVKLLQKCSFCKGTREKSGNESDSPVCYSCKGTGIKKDPLFHKEVRCNTCKGIGSLIHSPCQQC
jgi:molecular chaperone DnaJ